jgi:hypothetical protein
VTTIADPSTAPGGTPKPHRRWWVPLAASAAGLLLAGRGWLVWSVTRPAAPAQLGVCGLHPTDRHDQCRRVFHRHKRRGSADTLSATGAEFQTAAAARAVSLCVDLSCVKGGTVTIPAYSTVTFRADGPYLRVPGLGALAVGHPPLQLTLTFVHSGVVHILSPVGIPADLTVNDMMTYGYMDHRDPGMGGMGMSTTSTAGARSTTMPGMSGMGGPLTSRHTVRRFVGSAAVLAAPGFDALADREPGDAQADDRVQPPPPEQGVGDEADQHGGGEIGAQQVLGAFPGCGR